MIDKLQSYKDLLPRGWDATLFQQSDGCAAQYRSAKSILFYIMLANKYHVNMDVMISAPGHGKGLVDALSGVDKRYMEKLMNKEGRDLKGKKDKDEYGFQFATIGVDGKAINPAVGCAKALNNPNRVNGLKGSKKKYKEGEVRISHREYTAVEFKLDELKLRQTDFEIKGINKPKYLNPATGKMKMATTNNGIKTRYHIYASYHIVPGLNKAAVRRLPCACPLCCPITERVGSKTRLEETTEVLQYTRLLHATGVQRHEPLGFHYDRPKGTSEDSHKGREGRAKAPCK
jgi:hypothetical protein